MDAGEGEGGRGRGRGRGRERGRADMKKNTHALLVGKGGRCAGGGGGDFGKGANGLFFKIFDRLSSLPAPLWPCMYIFSVQGLVWRAYIHSTFIRTCTYNSYAPVLIQHRFTPVHMHSIYIDIHVSSSSYDIHVSSSSYALNIHRHTCILLLI